MSIVITLALCLTTLGFLLCLLYAGSLLRREAWPGWFALAIGAFFAFAGSGAAAISTLMGWELLASLAHLALLVGSTTVAISLMLGFHVKHHQQPVGKWFEFTFQGLAGAGVTGPKYDPADDTQDIDPDDDLFGL